MKNLDRKTRSTFHVTRRGNIALAAWLAANPKEAGAVASTKQYYGIK